MFTCVVTNNFKRCASGWSGSRCSVRTQQQRNPPKQNNPSPKIETKSPVVEPPMEGPQLHVFDVQTDRVTIGVPQRSRNYRLTVLGVSDLSDATASQTWKTLSQDTIFPPENLHEVKSLDPGTKYKICLGSLDEAEDFLCCRVETEAAITTASSKVEEKTEKAVEKVEEDRRVPHVNEIKSSTLEAPRTTTLRLQTTTNWRERTRTTNNRPKVQSKTTKEDEDTSMMYPLLGAGLAAFVILVLGLMLFLCQHNKRKLERGMGEIEEHGGGHRYSSSIKYTARPQQQYNDMYETSEMISTQQQYNFQPSNGVAYTQVPTFQQNQGKYLENYDGGSSLARSNVSRGSSQKRYSPASLPFSSNQFSTGVSPQEQMTSQRMLVQQGSPRNVVTMPTSSNHGNGCVSSNLVQYRSAPGVGHPFNQNTVSSSSSSGHHSNRSRTLATNQHHHHDNRRSYGSNYGVIYDTGHYPQLIPTNERTISEHVTATPVM